MLCFTEKTVSSLHSLFYPLATKLNPEWAHDFSLHSFSYMAKLLPTPCDLEEDKIKVGNLYWSFPIGLAAGLDKNASALDFFFKLSFGAIEVGTVTCKGQEGNPYPRIERLIKERSLLNRMGFNNVGAKDIFENIKKSNDYGKILGVNIGKNKEVSEQNAPFDYQKLYRIFSEVADYLVINISSPNTPGLRALQSKNSLDVLLKCLVNERKNRPRDLYVKISPDLNKEEVKDIIDTAIDHKITGLIATNTTLRPDLGVGGISGRLLKTKSTIIRNQCLEMAKDHLEIIGVGGVEGICDLWDFWSRGGNVMQIYTSFIYQGPKILLSIKDEIKKIKLQNNLKNMTEVIQFARANPDYLSCLK